MSASWQSGFMLVTGTIAIESPNGQEATNVHICLHLKGPTQETEVPKRVYISRGIPFFIEFLCDIATKWTLRCSDLSHYAAESCFSLISWVIARQPVPTGLFFSTNQMNAASHPGSTLHQEFRRKFRLEDITRGFRDTFPVSKCGTYVAKVMFTKWETIGALPGIFPLYPLNASFGSVRATGRYILAPDQFQLGRNE